jgi:SAM-dependent methyltransferase
MSLMAPETVFHSLHYLRHNHRRLEHLASLALHIRETKVLEVGAGIGDHTSFFLDRQCEVTCIEGRSENLRALRERYPNIRCIQMDIDAPESSFVDEFDIVYCYGVLYHLRNPANAIAYMAKRCRGMLLLETRVSYGEGELLNPTGEDRENPSFAVSGQGCRPTRDWVRSRLTEHFEYVYVTRTQPNHEEFPVDWTQSPSPELRTRSVFVASRSRLSNGTLTEELPMFQTRHD